MSTGPSSGALRTSIVASLRVADAHATSSVEVERKVMRTSVRSSSAAAELERLGERRDERQAEAEAGAVGAREHPAALVAHGDREAAVAQRGGDLHRAVAVGVGVDDDVRARLGDGELDVGEHLVVDVEGVAEPAEGMADDGDVLCARWKGEDEIGRGHHVRLI